MNIDRTSASKLNHARGIRATLTVLSAGLALLLLHVAHHLLLHLAPGLGQERELPRELLLLEQDLVLLAIGHVVDLQPERLDGHVPSSRREVSRTLVFVSRAALRNSRNSPCSSALHSDSAPAGKPVIGSTLSQIHNTGT